MSKNITLTTPSLDGLDDMHEYSVMPEFFRHLEYPAFKTKSQTKKYLENMILLNKTKQSNYWFITLTKNKKTIGTCGFRNIDERRLSAEFGYGISPLFQGRGYFFNAASLALDYAAECLSLRRIWSITAMTNSPSVRGLNSLGFEQEGVLKDFYRRHNGQFFDAVLYSKLLKNGLSSFGS